MYFVDFKLKIGSVAAKRECNFPTPRIIETIIRKLKWIDKIQNYYNISTDKGR